MAKWGEGDPRWLVEERPDATNVNNWHWTEKNAALWSQNKLSELLIGLKAKDDLGTVEIVEMLTCTGDAVAINRKGKLILFYEWNFEMKYKGITHYGVVVEGRVGVRHFTEEQDIKDIDIAVYFEEDGAESTLFGNIMQNEGTELIRKQLSLYVTGLKEDFAKDIFLPTHTSVQETPARKRKISDQYHKYEQKSLKNLSEFNLDLCDLHSTEIFKCTAEEFYRVLTVEELVQAFTKSHCVLEPKEGGKFELFDGNVQGYFVKLEPFQTLKLKWRFTSWPKDHFSDVTLNIDQKTDCTEVRLSQYGIPKQEKESTEEGWKRHYWDSIRKNFGFGAFLF